MKMAIARRVVKVSAIVWMSAIFVTMAFVATIVGYAITRPLDREIDDARPIWKLVVDFLAYVCYLTAVVYAARALEKRIPFPLDGVAGFSYTGLRDDVTLPLFEAMLVTFSRRWQQKTEYLFSRVMHEFGSRDT